MADKIMTDEFLIDNFLWIIQKENYEIINYVICLPSFDINKEYLLTEMPKLDRGLQL